jgi:hypothetical protein
MSRRTLFPPVSLLLLSCLSLLSPGSSKTGAADKDHAEKHPLEWMRPGTSLESGYLFQGVVFEDGLKVYSFSFSKPEGADKFTLTIDPVKRKFNQFGDASEANVVSLKKIPATLTPIKKEDPAKKNRRLYAIEANKLSSRLILVVPAKQDTAHQLVVQDKDGNVEMALHLQVLKIVTKP